MMPKKFDFSLKIIAVGNGGVGKTSFLRRFVGKEFSPEEPHTIGVDFMTRVVKTETHCIQLQFWDTAGQEKFRFLVKSYFRAAAAALVLFDLTARDSFTDLGAWITDVREMGLDQVILVLIGHKSDLEVRREISSGEAKAFAEENHALYFEASAKTGENVSEAVDACVARIETLVAEGVYNFMAVSREESSFRQEEKGCGC
jgi:small GTP-binding protein